MSQSDFDVRRKYATAFLRKLEDRESVLTDEDKARRVAAKIRAIIAMPHKPFSCPTGSADSPDLERQCPTIKLTSQRCTLTPSAGQRLCMLHVVTHSSISVLLRTLWDAMEAARVEAAYIDGGGRGSSFNNADAVKHYINKVNDVVEALQQHQMTYSCRSECPRRAFASTAACSRDRQLQTTTTRS